MAEVRVREMPTDRGHLELLAELEQLAGHAPVRPERADAGDSYTAGGHPYYRVPVPDRRALVKRWLSARPGSTGAEILRTADRLLAGTSFEERTLGAMLLQQRRDARHHVSPSMVEQWLEAMVGWAEVDSLGQSVFDATDVLSDWPAWRAMILRLSESSNINQRRASLVLLTGPVRQSPDDRLIELALEVIDRAQAERDGLIAKAVSWLLRAAVVQHRAIVADYVDANERTLAPVAVREAKAKLLTGTKRGHAPRRQSRTGNTDQR